MVFQFGALFDSLSVRENVGFTLYERGEIPRAEIDRRVEECLETVNLPGSGHLMPADLSGGMKKRVGLARAMIKMNPEVQPLLKRVSLLTRDSREKERKKPGLKRARKAPTYTKR